MASTINASTSAGLVSTADTSGVLQLQTAGTTAVTVDASQNVGIGTTSPASYGGSAFTKSVNIGSLNTITAGFSDEVSGTFRIAHASGQNILNFDTSALCFQSGGSTPTERARINSSGNLMVNTTSTLDAVVSVVGRVGANAAPFALRVGTSGDYGFTFRNDAGTFVGAIGVNASTTSYVTSSDYRLKENIAPMAGALTIVAQLKPCTYTWKVDGSDGQGFIAHELAEVFPDAVTGVKDAVDEDGNIKSQGIDTSFLVATLTAAIQEQQIIIESLKSRLDAVNL